VGGKLLPIQKKSLAKKSQKSHEIREKSAAAARQKKQHLHLFCLFKSVRAERSGARRREKAK
jgi:hypothetical protein